MADLSITAANVLPSANAQIARGVAGATITAGQTIYQDVDSSLKLADANGASPLYVLKGIALNSASAGQPIDYVTQDPALAIGATVAAGTMLILSATPGAICPDTDAATGMFITVLGVGIGSNKINFNASAIVAGVAKP